MTVRRILKIGDPALRRVATAIEAFDTPELHELITDLLDTMRHALGAGLAATQIGVPKRVIVFGVESTPRYPEATPIPQTVLLNPEFVVIGDEMVSHWEGCLSVPGMRGYVPRHAKIRYHGFDPRGARITREAQGFHAGVFQHEYDHLDGWLFPDRILDRRKFGFEEELKSAGVL
jgi:peptide deformylase